VCALLLCIVARRQLFTKAFDLGWLLVV
jgi:hypothetical protein